MMMAITRIIMIMMSYYRVNELGAVKNVINRAILVFMHGEHFSLQEMKKREIQFGSFCSPKNLHRSTDELFLNSLAIGKTCRL